MEILYKICGNKIANSGYSSIVGCDDIDIADESHAGIAGCAPCYYTFRCYQHCTVYVMRRTDVTSYGASRVGRMAIAISIPHGWRLAEKKSPYDILNDIWDTYRTNYMVWGEYSKLYSFKNEVEDEKLFIEILKKYPLDRFAGSPPTPMTGEDWGWCMASSDEIREIMLDIRRDGLSRFSEFVLAEAGNSTNPQLDIHGPRKPQYAVYCNGKSIGTLDPGGEIQVKPLGYDERYYMVEHITITYSEIIEFLHDDSGSYKSGDATITVDNIRGRIDCQVNVAERRCICYVNIDIQQISTIEEQLNHRFKFSDFRVYICGKLIPISDGCQEISLCGEEIDSDIRVEWAEGSPYQDDYKAGFNDQIDNDASQQLKRIISITVTEKQHGSGKGADGVCDLSPEPPKYKVRVIIDRKRHDADEELKATFVWNSKPERWQQKLNSDDETIYITEQSLEEWINKGQDVDVYISCGNEDYKESKYKIGHLDRNNIYFKNGSAEITIERKVNRLKRYIICFAVIILIVAIMGVGAWYFLSPSDDPAPTEHPEKSNKGEDPKQDDNLVAWSEIYSDYLNAKTFTDIIELYEKYFDGNGNLRNESNGINPNTVIEQELSLFKTGYQAAKIIESLGYNKDTGQYICGDKTGAINKLFNLKENSNNFEAGRKDLENICTRILSSAPITETILKKRFESDDIQEWEVFCNGVKPAHNNNNNNNKGKEEKTNKKTDEVGDTDTGGTHTAGESQYTLIRVPKNNQ